MHPAKLLASQQSCLPAERNLALACLLEGAQKSQTTAVTRSVRHSTGKDTRNLVVLHQTNLTKNPLNYFEQHIGSVPADSHIPFMGQKRTESLKVLGIWIKRNDKSTHTKKKRGVVASNGPPQGLGLLSWNRKQKVQSPHAQTCQAEVANLK